MKRTFFFLVSALVILVAIVSMACAGEVQSSRENITRNLSTNMTINHTTPAQMMIVIGRSREDITPNGKGLVTSNKTSMTPSEGKLLHAGGRNARESNALGRNSSSQKTVTEIGLEPRAEFNLSQRYGSVSKFKFNSDSIAPLFSQNRYTRTKPTYLAPDNLSTRGVYNLSGYPVIMLPNAIP